MSGPSVWALVTGTSAVDLRGVSRPLSLVLEGIVQTEVVQHCLVCGCTELEVVDKDNALNSCRSCKFVFDSPRPTVEELITFYSKFGQYDDWLEAGEARDRLWVTRVQKMLPTRRRGNLLDVGTGIGQFLHHAKPYFDDVYGTEVSSSAIEIARSRYGLDVFEGKLEDLQFKQKFDNITVFHVLEHVPDPRQLVDHCFELLNPAGMLYIAVPNELRSALRATKDRLGRLGIPRYRSTQRLGIPRIRLDGSMGEIHLSHFREESLQLLLQRAGFVVVEAGLDPYSVATGHRGLIDKSLLRVGNVVKRVTGVNIYDAIWMAAVKPVTS